MFFFFLLWVADILSVSSLWKVHTIFDNNSMVMVKVHIIQIQA